jgi:hypothetical protein
MDDLPPKPSKYPSLGPWENPHRVFTGTQLGGLMVRKVTLNVSPEDSYEYRY